MNQGSSWDKQVANWWSSRPWPIYDTCLNKKQPPYTTRTLSIIILGAGFRPENLLGLHGGHPPTNSLLPSGHTIDLISHAELLPITGRHRQLAILEGSIHWRFGHSWHQRTTVVVVLKETWYDNIHWYLMWRNRVKRLVTPAIHSDGFTFKNLSIY